jgi:hypothetical protein
MSCWKRRGGCRVSEVSAIRRNAPWLAIWGLTLALTALSTAQSLRAYRDFRSGWPWDLAYNNQWCWALVFGDQTLSIRPINSWGNEGPSIWVRTHLDPIRLAVMPFYAIWPGPEILIVAHNVIIWWLVPAAFGLLRSETRSDIVALTGAALVPLTPLLWPLLWNDFREMELALPFVLWAIQGFRLRDRGLAALGIVGMLASREEFGVMIATFALLPPKADEDIGTTYAWARTAVFLGIGWVLFAFFGFQYLMVSHHAPELYLGHFGGPKPTLVEVSKTALDMLFIGIGSWTVLAVFAPRIAVLALPWLWGVSSGRWSLSLLATPGWHHVRYMTPIVALVLAAGLFGYGRLGVRAIQGRRGGWVLAGLWLVSALGMGLAGKQLASRFDRIEWPISRAEAAEIRRWVDAVGPDEAVLSAYEVCAPLSSRRVLYSNRMDMNKPSHYPDLGPEFRWAFIRKNDLPPDLLIAQGFRIVHRGDFIWIYRRDGAS